MNILMTKSWEAPEYLDDGLLHGLRRLFGDRVVDYPRMWHMYADSFGPGKVDQTTIVGRGYTLYGMMDDSTVDRTDIEQKIRNQYFDLIIMHSWYPSLLMNLILETTPVRRIVWIDGRDERQVLTQFIDSGHYFKRELTQPMHKVKPISFGFPAEKIQAPVDKTRSVAHCVAGDLSTYIFKTEDTYYHQYNEALFGITTVKGGWDCMRHYEIMGARCVPFFVNLEGCPTTTCTTLPKREYFEVNSLIAQHGTDSLLAGALRDRYEELRASIHAAFVSDCTTTSLARYVIDSVRGD